MTWNVLLDDFPKEYEGYPINTSFRIGIMITQALYDNDLANFERYATACNLLFEGKEKHPDEITAQKAVDWFLSGWYTDKITGKEKKNDVPIMDYDVDQWRILSSFLTQFDIDLSVSDMHFWKFMGLMSTLEECAFTRVIDIRTRKIDPKLPPDSKKELKSLKEKYSLGQDAEHEMSAQEKEEYETFMSYAKKSRKNTPEEK